MVSEATSLPGSLATIQPATWRDLNSLRHLERLCFPQDAWPLLDLVGILTLPNVVRLKAEATGPADSQAGGQTGRLMVGFVAGDVRTSQHIAWIATIGVLPEYRGRGIGRKLLEACEAQIQEPRVRLCVRASNQAAIQMYLSSSYQRAGLWPNYYQDGEEALVMEKRL
jgi:ribosomal protein S18 acetylase RimI-like enzyme